MELGSFFDTLIGNTSSLLAFAQPQDECWQGRESNQIVFLSLDQQDQIPADAIYDCVVITQDINDFSKNQSMALIAKLRDCHAKQVIILVDEKQLTAETACVWKVSDFLSLGMKQLPSLNFDDSAFHVFYFAIENYKWVPDWLNSRHWANPENFHKYRW